jgi:short-subunit dehydrogenase
MIDSGVALVTGTSSGIGLHTAVGLARAGLTVVATMREPGTAGALESAAAAAGVEVDIRALDVVDETQAALLVAGLERVDVLVNNAGQGSVGTLEQLSLSPEDAAAVVVEAATTGTPKFRWQTSESAVAFAGLSLGDLDGSRVLSATSGWLG